MRVGARTGKGTAAGANERLHHGRGRRAKSHRVVGGTHKGRHAGGRLDHDSQGSRPASSREYASLFGDIQAIAVECFGIINQPGDRLGELALLEGKDAAVAGTERRDRGAIDDSLRIARPRWEFACILGHGVREGVDRHGDTVDGLGRDQGQAAAAEHLGRALDGEPMRLARSLVYPIDRLHVYASPLRSGESLFTEGHSRTKHSAYLPRAHVGLVSGSSSR